MIKVVKQPTPMSEIERIEPLLMASTPYISREEIDERADPAAILEPVRGKGKAKQKKGSKTK